MNRSTDFFCKQAKQINRHKTIMTTKLLLLTICCVIVTSLAGPFSSEKEEKLEAALNDIEVVLQDLRPNEDASLKATLSDNKNFGDFQKPKPAFTSSLDMEEILLHTEDIEKATAEIEAIGGRVAIQMGHNLLIANVPADIASKQDAFLHASSSIPSTAPEVTHQNAKAYEMYREDKRGPQPKVQKWTEKTAPKSYPPESDSPLPADSPYTMTMRGKIALGLIVPSGPGDLAMSDTEDDHVYSEVLRGLKFWSDNAPADASLSFVVYHGKALIEAGNASVGCSGAGCHDVFAVPGYEYFGFSSRDDVAQWCKDDAGADGAFVAFISKYRQGHFAYAYFEGGPIYMQYWNDGWGPDEIDRVFAHEVGHVFNAPDEYTDCSCYSNYGKGTCTARNDNCAEDNEAKCTYNQQKCIMDSNDLDHICSSSRKHVGWC